MVLRGQADLDRMPCPPGLCGGVAHGSGSDAVIDGGAGPAAGAHTVHELLHLQQICLPEPLREGGHALRPDATGAIHPGQVFLRHGGDPQRPLSAHDLRLHMVAVGAGAAHVDGAHGAVFKPEHRQARLIVSRLPELRMLEGGAQGIDLRCLTPQEPTHQVDVVDGGVQENAAGIFTKADGILHHRLRIQTRGLHQIGRADNPGIHLPLGIGIGGVVAAHEPQHEHKLRVALHGSLGLEALGDVHPQGLFGKDVLSCVQCRLDLPAVL